MRYFDFHAHIILKQLFSDQPNIDTLLSKKDLKGIISLLTPLGNVIRSQIHQSQLADMNQEVMVGVVFYSLETALAEEVRGLRNLLKQSSRHKLSETVLQRLANGQEKPFTDFILGRTLSLYLSAPQSFNILTRESFDNPLPTNKVNIFFSVEGCHSLRDTTGPGTSPTATNLLANLDKLLEQVPVVSAGLAHLQPFGLSNHAFGAQITDDAPFMPTGNGLTPEGHKMAQGLFDRGIHVDLKHMSYKSRLDLRTAIDANEFQRPLPLICTHAAFTGIPFTQWPGYINRHNDEGSTFYVETAKTMQTRNMPRRPGAPAFNMTTINLFDEEIAWLVKQGGLIGLSADRRILGYIDEFDKDPTGRNPSSTMYVDKEFISKAEWVALGLNGADTGNRIDPDDCVQEDDVSESTDSDTQRADYYFKHFLLQIKHYFTVCRQAGIPIARASQHIVLGTDFDGLINPFLNLATVSEMAQLKSYIQLNLRPYLQSLTDSSDWADELDVFPFVEALFYENGARFIRNHFTQ